MSKFVFEDKIEDIDQLLAKNRGKWKLDAIAWMGYEDVCQIIRLHIHNKWHLWDQERPFKPWVSALISHQIYNQIRNNYYNFARPCLRCEHNLGADGCAITPSQNQDTSCALFAKWRKKKENHYNLKIMTVPLEKVEYKESPIQKDMTEEDFAVSAEKLHELVIERLGAKHKEVYRMLFVENCSEEEVAKRFGFSEDKSKRRKPRYKQISNLKKKFREIAADILKNTDLD